uniref:Uncharacterized protein n=1 Tax=Ditylenchus dipsaci TaxID=166011 RepID=A0A915DIF4_9BILA
MQGLELVIDEYESPKRGKATKFKQLDLYESEDLFNAWSSSGLASWKLHQSRDLEKSWTDEYMCDYTRLRNYSCQMKLKIRRPHDSKQIIVEQSYRAHQHKPKKPVVLNENVKKIVREDKLCQPCKFRTKFSQRQTRSSNPLPSVKQLENLKYRNKKVRMIRLSNLRQYVDSKHHLPEDCNEPYVVEFDTRIEDETKQFAWSGRLDDFPNCRSAQECCRWMALTRPTGWIPCLVFF